MTSREQIYKAALEDVLGGHSMECEGAKCFPRVLTRLQDALEAAAKVGDDVFVCNAICCDDSHPDHAQELRRLLAEAEAPICGARSE